MQSSARIDELRQKFHENPRRYFAPLANEYRKAGDPEQAIAICRAHLAQQPAHMSGHVVYAQALYDAGRMDESRVVFEKALSLDPDNAIVLRQLGDISRQKGDTAEAKHWYSRALDADPHDREIAAYIAELTEPLTESEAEAPASAPVDVPEAVAEPAPIEVAPEPVMAEAPPAPAEPASEPAEAEMSLAAAEPAAEPASEESEELQLEKPSEMASIEDQLDVDTTPLDIEPYAEASEPVEAQPIEAKPIEAEPVEAEPIAVAGHEVSAPAQSESAPEPIEPVELARDEKADVAPLEEVETAPAEELSTPADVEVDIPTTEEPPALTDMPGFEIDEALFAADEDVELFPDSSSPFVTRTMADLYARQGYNDQALEVYKKLAADNPHDQEIADRIRELSSADAAPAAAAASDQATERESQHDYSEPTDETSSPSVSSDKPVHFTDTEIGGDEWDTSSWGSGFSTDEHEVQLFDDEPAVPVEPIAPEPVATDDREVTAESTPDAEPVSEAVSAAEAEPEEPIRHRADATLIAETDRTGEFAAPTPPLGVFNDAREEEHEEIYRPSDEPIAIEPSFESHAPIETVAEEPLDLAPITPDAEAPVEPEPVAFHELEQPSAETAQSEEVEDAWRPEDAVAAVEPEASAKVESADIESFEADSTEGEAEHFVAYSPQLPEEEDLPHYTPVGPTIREFFATLGAYKPPANGAAASFTARTVVPDIEPEPTSYEPEETVEQAASTEATTTEPQPVDEFPLVTDAFANLFPDSPVSDEDSKAAFALSGALSSQPAQPAPRTYTTPQSPAPSVESPPPPAATQESEEDIRRFREWLDGLAES